MTREPSNSLAPPRTFARLLSFLLLGFIFYGTTVEAAHKHVSLVESAKSSSLPSVSDSGNGGDIAGKLAGCGECLICQLHQHFSASLVPERDTETLQQARTGITQLKLHLFKSGVVTPRSGRAPPLAIQ